MINILYSYINYIKGCYILYYYSYTLSTTIQMTEARIFLC